MNLPRSKYDGMSGVICNCAVPPATIFNHDSAHPVVLKMQVDREIRKYVYKYNESRYDKIMKLESKIADILKQIELHEKVLENYNQ